jgi:hypothetical protein
MTRALRPRLGGSSSVSIGELWHGVDQLDEAVCEGIFAFTTQSPPRGSASRSRANFRGLEGMGEVTSRAVRGASIDEATGLSSTPPRDCGGGSMKNKVAWILSNDVGAISPHIRRSFIDRQYSPSTGMDWSEWEIILEELIWMRFIVKKEHVSDGDD